MKDFFLGYYQPTQEEFTYLWDNSIFILDANVLLNLYRYTPNTRAEFFKILDRISERLWIPHQVALEYQRNRLSVIDQQKKAYTGVIEILEDAQRSVEGKLSEYRRHTYIDVPSILKRTGKLFAILSKELKLEQDQHPDLLATDDLRMRITDLLEKKVGLTYTSDKLKGIYAEGEKRYLSSIPPGYMDAKEKKDNSKYSDLVLWFQIMDKAKEQKVSVILISDDAKEDWWWIFSGKVIGPRPELIEEFMTFTNMKIYMYPSDRFMEYARDFLKERIGQKAINEVQNVRKDEEDKNIREALGKQRQESELSAFERLRLDWKQKIPQLPSELLRTPAAALLRSMEPIAIEDDCLILSCKYQYHKEKLEEPENIVLAEKIISIILGRECHIRIVHEPPVSQLFNS